MNWLLLVATLLTSALVFKTNPNILRSPQVVNAATTPDLFLEPTTLWRPTPSLEDTSSKIIYYRGNQERQGTFPLFKVGPMKKDWEISGFNVGVHGASKATPIADESGVYVGSDSSWFYAFRLDGSLKWKFFDSHSNRGFHSTAVIVGNYVYVGSYSGMIYCFQKEDGRLMWSKKIGETVGASPVFYKGDLIAAVETLKPVNGFVVRLSAQDGAIKWISPFLGEQSHSSPAISEEHKMVLLGANNRLFFGLDLDSGKMRWSLPATGEVKSTPLIVKNRVYFTDWGGYLHCLDIQSGQEIWKRQMALNSQVSASYAPQSNLVLVGDSLGSIYGVTPETGELKWTKKFKITKLLSSPVVILAPKETLIVACSDTEACWMRTKDGHLLSKISLGHQLTSTPFLREKEIYFSLNNGPLQKWILQ